MAQRRMLFLPVFGDPRMVDVGDDLETIRETIGATWVERARVGRGWSMAVNETGRMFGRPVNETASILYLAHMHGNPICGDVLLGREDFVSDGVDWVDVDEETAKTWLSAAIQERCLLR